MGRTIAIWAVVAHTAAAAADPDAATRAQHLFDEGRALAKAGKTQEACALFEQSLALDAAVGAQLNVADCAEHDGHLVRAWELFDAAATASEREGNVSRARFARNRADVLAMRIATVEVNLDERQLNIPGLAVTIGSTSVRPAREIQLRMEPGEITIVFSAPGYLPHHETVTATPGATFHVPLLKLEVDPAARAATPISRTPPPVVATVATVARVEPRSRRDRGRVKLAWIVGGAAAASGVTAIAVATWAKLHWDRAVAARDFASANHDYQIGTIGTGRRDARVRHCAPRTRVDRRRGHAERGRYRDRRRVLSVRAALLLVACTACNQLLGLHTFGQAPTRCASIPRRRCRWW
jgi:hypothetical protein